MLLALAGRLPPPAAATSEAPPPSDAPPAVLLMRGSRPGPTAMAWDAGGGASARTPGGSPAGRALADALDGRPAAIATIVTAGRAVMAEARAEATRTAQQVSVDAPSFVRGEFNDFRLREGISIIKICQNLLIFKLVFLTFDLSRSFLYYFFPFILIPLQASAQREHAWADERRRLERSVSSAEERASRAEDKAIVDARAAAADAQSAAAKEIERLSARLETIEDVHAREMAQVSVRRVLWGSV
jgi:hypothetical protein